MMGKKEQHFAPLIQVSLEELVPHDHFYRHLERTLDLSCVREFVQQSYAGGGRPSIDPVVFFKLKSEVMDNQPMLDLLWPRQVTAKTGKKSYLRSSSLNVSNIALRSGIK
jgi:hypothetical protein